MITASVNLRFVAYCLAALPLLCHGPSFAQDAARDSVVARVNGKPLSRVLIDQMKRGREAPNPYDAATGVSPAAPVLDRQQLLEELLMTEVLAQKALEDGLDRDPSVIAQRELQVSTLLSQQMVRQLIGQVSVSPEEVAARFEERVPPFDFKVQRIVVAQRPQAEALIERALRGERWQSIARGHRAHAAPWLMHDQLGPDVAAAVRRLNPGTVAPRPVRVDGGWAVLRLDARRAAPRPALEEASVWLKQQILAEKVQARLDAIRAQARIDVAPDALGK